METKKIFLLYAPDAEASRNAAKRCEEEIVNFGGSFSDLGVQDVKESLKAADFLICFVSSQEEFSVRAFEDAWRYFDNELSWKRKTSGEIIMVLDGEAEGYRLPFRLRDRKIFSFETFHIEKVLNTASPQSNSSAAIQNQSSPPVTKPRAHDADGRKTSTSQKSAEETPAAVKPNSIKIKFDTTGLTENGGVNGEWELDTEESNDDDAFDFRVDSPYEDAHVRIQYRPDQSSSEQKLGQQQDTQSDKGDEYDPFSFDSRQSDKKKAQNNQTAGFIVAIVIGMLILYAALYSIAEDASCAAFIDSFVLLQHSVQRLVQNVFSAQCLAIGKNVAGTIANFIPLV